MSNGNVVQLAPITPVVRVPVRHAVQSFYAGRMVCACGDWEYTGEIGEAIERYADHRGPRFGGA